MKKYDILVVDDSENFRDLIKDFLQKQSEIGKVIVSGSGSDAIELLKNFNPSVILMDIVMPGMNGFEASQKIRQINPDVPIIILSGNEATDSREAVEKLGLNGFINKVNLVSELMPVIFKSLRNKQI